MSEQQSNEKKEKKSEDWEEMCEDWMGDWWKQDRLDAIGWAAGFFWAALVLLAGTTKFAAKFPWWDGGAVFFTGAGIISLSVATVRLLVPEYRQSWLGNLIFGLILLAIGLGTWEVCG